MVEPELAVAQAAGFLPGEYAAVRNVLGELGRRMGKDWWRLGEDGNLVDKPAVLEVSGGLGSGLWYVPWTLGRYRRVC